MSRKCATVISTWTKVLLKAQNSISCSKYILPSVLKCGKLPTFSSFPKSSCAKHTSKCAKLPTEFCAKLLPNLQVWTCAKLPVAPCAKHRIFCAELPSQHLCVLIIPNARNIFVRTFHLPLNLIVANRPALYAKSSIQKILAWFLWIRESQSFGKLWWNFPRKLLC